MHEFSNSGAASGTESSDGWSWTMEEMQCMRQNDLVGKKVIVHDVTKEDTVAGIAITYGIKVGI